ncbi:NAD(P)H-hydrate dehydratase [Candidatus Peribacteria bacterium]|nr:NAD(P)H-hydrate dehydratase [Candidatus Peribacteria bacterium]
MRDPLSHKGDNGTVAVVGGSHFMHGAPIFAALAAEGSGADLVHVCIPSAHAEVTRMQSLNFQVHPFQGPDLSRGDRSGIVELLATMDCAVLGPGIGRDTQALRTLQDIIEETPCPIVLDASALQPWTLSAIAGKTAVLTPHLGELERMGIPSDGIADYAKKHRVHILAKGAVDRVVAPDGTVTEIAGGNAGLTVGGTGDALAGLVAGLLSQGFSPRDACRRASTVIKRSGALLYPKFGYAYGTRRVIEQIPMVLHALVTDGA